MMSRLANYAFRQFENGKVLNFGNEETSQSMLINKTSVKTVIILKTCVKKYL